MGVLLSILIHAAFKIAYTVLYISIVVGAIHAYVASYRTFVNSISPNHARDC